MLAATVALLTLSFLISLKISPFPFKHASNSLFLVIIASDFLHFYIGNGKDFCFFSLLDEVQYLLVGQPKSKSGARNMLYLEMVVQYFSILLQEVLRNNVEEVVMVTCLLHHFQQFQELQ